MAAADAQKTDLTLTVPGEALRALVDAVGAADFGSMHDALESFAALTVDLCAAEAAVVRLADADGTHLAARAVHAVSPSLAAELAGSLVVPGDGPRTSPLAFQLSVPVEFGGELLGSLDVLRDGAPFSDGERLLAQLAAGELALALRALDGDAAGVEWPADRALVLAGEALTAGSDSENAAAHLVQLAADAADAQAAVLWRAEAGEPTLAASFGDSPAAESAALSAARVALASHGFLLQERIGGAAVVSVRLGEPTVGVLQLVFSDDPPQGILGGLTTFALRAAQAIRAGDDALETARDLARTRALLTAVAQASAQLSLQHVLTTALEQVAALLGTNRVAVYLRDGKRLEPAASRNLPGAHGLVAEALRDVVFEMHRGRGIVVIEDVERERSLVSIVDAAREAGIHAALALPLVVRGEALGLIAAYPEEARQLSDDEEALLVALAAQLAITIENARLYEREKAHVAELKSELTTERDSARRVQALYEIAESFAQSLSLEATLEALARSAVESLGVDAAVIRMPDARREVLEKRALYVGASRLAEAVTPVLSKAQPLDVGPIRRLFRTRRPLLLTPAVARELGEPHRLLVPFLEKGSTAALLPIATPAEVIGTLLIVSFDPGQPVTKETRDTALSIAGQAALAIDNGRLYQQQKEFADTMRRSLLPRSQPRLQGLEIGQVYQPSTRVDVGGDVYDFLELADGRLAVVLGDVTGHGIEATADMAMAKFVFRSLAREHPEPADFLASANEVVVGEIATGKFITMIYLTVRPDTGAVVAASAGHPAPLVVSPAGDVAPLDVRGLALGVEPGQTYEENSALLERGGALVVYTDGVIEARRDGELYGTDRLIQLVSAWHQRPPAETARAVIEDCRSFAGDLADDCAVVVIKR